MLYDEDFEILKIKKEKNYFSILLKDKKENFDFWLDCTIIDDGEKYINWNFNQYIFFDNDENDQRAKQYQENYRKCENISCFLLDFEIELIETVEGMR